MMRQRFSATSMQGKAIRRCGSNVPTGVVQVAGASIVPGFGIQVLSEDPNERAIQRTVFLK